MAISTLVLKNLILRGNPCTMCTLTRTLRATLTLRCPPGGGGTTNGPDATYPPLSVKTRRGGG